MGKLFIVVAMILLNVVIDIENHNKFESEKKEANEFGYELVY